MIAPQETTTTSAEASAPPEASAEPSAAPAAAVPAVPTGYAELDQALGADKPFNGKTVSIQTQWIGGEGTNFAAAVADFRPASARPDKIKKDAQGGNLELLLERTEDVLSDLSARRRPGQTLVGFAITLVPPIHIYRQLRGAYRLSRFSAFWRTVVLLQFAVLASTIFLTMLLMLGLLG